MSAVAARAPAAAALDAHVAAQARSLEDVAARHVRQPDPSGGVRTVGPDGPAAGSAFGVDTAAVAFAAEG